MMNGWKLAVIATVTLGLAWASCSSTQQTTDDEQPVEQPSQPNVVEQPDEQPEADDDETELPEGPVLALPADPPPPEYDDPQQEFEAAEQVFEEWKEFTLPGVTEEHWDYIQERIDELDEVEDAYRRVVRHYDEGAAQGHGLEWLLAAMVRVGQAHSHMSDEISHTLDRSEHYDAELARSLGEEFLYELMDVTEAHFERVLDAAGTHQIESRWVEEIFDEMRYGDPQIVTRWLSDYPQMDGFVLDYYEQRCSDDDSRPCVRLARLLRDGEYVEPDPQRAVSLFDDSCDAGDPKACYELAVTYEEGIGVEQDEARGEELMEHACNEMRSFDACMRLDER